MLIKTKFYSLIFIILIINYSPILLKQGHSLKVFD